MEQFPILRSGGIVQYPVRTKRGPVRTHVEFWGGGGQTYLRKRSDPLSWTVRYSGLSEEEAASLLEFCERYAESGAFFSFSDPSTGVVYDKCAVEADSIAAASMGVNAYEFGATINRIEE